MLQASTLKFLKDLKKNNNREWFNDHKDIYEKAKADVVEFTAAVLTKSSTFDPGLKNLVPAKCIMRIYRDVRFSKNKDPYKLNFGIPFSSKTKGVEGPSYYLHIQPNESFLGGGCWMPQPDKLKLIRQEIDYNSKDFLAIVDNPSFKKMFGKLSEEDKLKTTPKDYDKEHPQIEYLKLKSYLAMKSISDAELLSTKAVDIVVNANKTIKPLIDFLNHAYLIS